VIEQPRLVVAGLRGGSGKTILTLGLARHWRKSGVRVKPFKKGPDYIDAVWSGRAAGQTATNLDPFLMTDEQIRGLFAEQVQGFDLGLIEGNRGLFDGKDLDGSCSTAHIARLLDSPVLLIVDCTKMTRTVAALVQGVMQFEPRLNIGGVVLNCTAGQRHRSILRQCVETYTDVPVLGALPRMRRNPIPERHMGLISDQEYDADQALDDISDSVREWLDTGAILDLARQAPPFQDPCPVQWPAGPEIRGPVRIGVVKDTSLWFYYPENLKALEQAGAEVVQVSLLEPDPWPVIHGLYLGGGFPETQAAALSRNRPILNHIAALADRGMPIYAECGGLMVLCSELTFQETSFSMAGVFPVKTEVSRKPQGHGYTLARVQSQNPYHPVGAEFSGHEFHYSRCSCLDSTEPCLRMIRGIGLGSGGDGMLYRNTFACYTHLHVLSVPSWAPNFVRAAQEFKSCLDTDRHACSRIIAL